MIAGIATDWLLKRWLGECPDEKWDRYLANYATSLPNDSSRAGAFQPLPSFWDRLFHSNENKHIVFPASPKQARMSISKDGHGLLSGNDDDHAQEAHHIHDLSAFPVLLKHPSTAQFKPEQEVKRKAKDITGRRGRKPIKFRGPLSSDSSLSDSDFSDTDKFRPWLNQKASMTSSTPTLVDEHLHVHPSLDYDLNVEFAYQKKGYVKAGGGTGGDLSDYSDYEEDLGLQQQAIRRKEDVGNNWSPGFLNRHSSSSVNASVGGRNTNGALPVGVVPATPSLMKALDRVSEAQREAFGVAGVGGLPRNIPRVSGGVHLPSPSLAPKARADGLPRVEEQAADNDDLEQNKPGWDDFWRDVTEKARN